MTDVLDTRVITAARIAAMPPLAPGIPSGINEVIATLDNGSEVVLFRYFTDELHFTAQEFLGLTVGQALDLFARRDMGYLRS